jgi:hypothetical protein
VLQDESLDNIHIARKSVKQPRGTLNGGWWRRDAFVKFYVVDSFYFSKQAVRAALQLVFMVIA